MSLMKSFLLSVALVLAATVFCAAADGSAAPLLADAVAEEFAVEVAVPDSVAPSTTTTTTTTASPAAGDKHRRTLSSSLSGPVCYHGQLPSWAFPEGRCQRSVFGFDITGVTNFVQFPTTSACQCMLSCFSQSGTCASWVWKFTGPHQSTRVCTLYSDFNFPSATTLGISLTTSSGLGVIPAGSNPQAGGLVPHCTLDGSSNGTPDSSCVSGVLWALDNNNFVC